MCRSHYACFRLNGNHQYDGPTYNENRTQVLTQGEPSTISDFRGDYTFDPGQWPQIQDNVPYDVTLQLPSDRYQAYVPEGGIISLFPPVVQAFYDAENGGAQPPDFKIVAPTVITGIGFDSPAGELLPIDPQGVSGRVVSLLASDSSVFATTTTSASGIYSFYDVPMGTYTVALESVFNTLVIGAQTTLSPRLCTSKPGYLSPEPGQRRGS